MKPNLSATIDPMRDANAFDVLKFPLYVSPKLDGIRALAFDGSLVTRNLKPIPRKVIVDEFNKYQGLDGELIVGNPAAFDVYNWTQSYVMSKDDRDLQDFKFFVFDDFTCPDDCFEDRNLQVAERVVDAADQRLVHVPQRLVFDLSGMLAAEADILEQGYEGIMLRNPKSPYKFGRSTLKEQGLMKLKRFADDEAEVIGFVEQMTNTNEATTNALGLTERSTAKAGMLRSGTLGKFVCRFNDVTIEVGCGFLTRVQRRLIWDNREDFIGRILKFRHFPHGAKDLPRFPRFVGWRDHSDM